MIMTFPDRSGMSFIVLKWYEGIIVDVYVREKAEISGRAGHI
jgi:hypothetical protein